MAKEHMRRVQQGQEDEGAATSTAQGKQPWQEPKLAFVEPKLTKHGALENVTGGFFGTFEP